jgi:hypothetical protein
MARDGKMSRPREKEKKERHFERNTWFQLLAPKSGVVPSSSSKRREEREREEKKRRRRCIPPRHPPMLVDSLLLNLSKSWLPFPVTGA